MRLNRGSHNLGSAESKLVSVQISQGLSKISKKPGPRLSRSNLSVCLFNVPSAASQMVRAEPYLDAVASSVRMSRMFNPLKVSENELH